jgi:hypothetical protein
VRGLLGEWGARVERVYTDRGRVACFHKGESSLQAPESRPVPRGSRLGRQQSRPSALLVRSFPQPSPHPKGRANQSHVVHAMLMRPPFLRGATQAPSYSDLGGSSASDTLLKGGTVLTIRSLRDHRLNGTVRTLLACRGNRDSRQIRYALFTEGAEAGQKGENR